MFCICTCMLELLLIKDFSTLFPQVLSASCRAEGSPRAVLGSHLGRGSCRKPDTNSAPPSLVQDSKEQFEFQSLRD